MKLYELDMIKSERGRRAALSALFFGAKNALLSAAANFESIDRTARNLLSAGYSDRAEAVRSSARYQKLFDSAQTAASRAMSIHALSEASNAVFEVDFTPEVRGKDLKQLTACAEATGIDIEVLKAKEAAEIKRRYDQLVAARSVAEGLFWSAGVDEEIEINPETVLRALVRQRDYMLQWSTLDLAELIILRHDIEWMQKYIETDEEKEASEGSVDDTDQEASMTRMNQVYQAEIEAQKPASRRRRRVVKAV